MSTVEVSQNRSDALSTVARSAGRLIGEGGWLAERARDALRWPVELTLRFPARARRLATTLSDVEAARPVLLPQQEPQGVKGWAKPLVASWPRLAPAALAPLIVGSRLFDLVGGPEAAEFILRALTTSTPLTDAERAAGQEMLGAHALAWDDVRVAQGGILVPFFKLNGNRAFTFFHTVNLPLDGRHARKFTDILVHELVHVYQYELVGSAYMLEALYAQNTAGAYDYGKDAGLTQATAAGRPYKAFNREQQAQIVQDYYCLFHPVPGEDNRTDNQRKVVEAVYVPFVGQCREGLV